ncbi:uncharacterized protein LOC144109901 isoform X2 [Amblyomma americanum]
MTDATRSSSDRAPAGRRRWRPLLRPAERPAASPCVPPTNQTEEQTAATAPSGTCTTPAPTATGSGRATPATSSTANSPEPATTAAAESRTESIKYELASRPNPGLLGRFFAEKGYQRGRPVPETPSQATSPPRRGGTWESDADWRTRISGLASHEKRSRRTAKLVLAQQALSRLRRWTSGHHHRAADGSPVRQDLMEEAKSAEEARTLLRQPPYDHEAYSEDASMGGGGGTKTSSSAGDLLLRAGVPPSHYKGISRRVQSTTAVPAKTQEAGHLRASGDFCFPSTSGGPYQEGLRAASAASSEVAWSNAKKGHLFATSQRSIDGFFRRLVRKK